MPAYKEWNIDDGTNTLINRQWGAWMLAKFIVYSWKKIPKNPYLRPPSRYLELITKNSKQMNEAIGDPDN